MRGKILLILASALLLCSTLYGYCEETLDKAKSLFEQYVQYEENFDTHIANLYSDNALIQSTRKYPDGSTRTIHFPPQRYKAMLRQLMPLAKARGDKGDYSNVEYEKEGAMVRIHAQRYSRMKDYSAPVTLLVGPDQNGTWVIHEEYSVTQP